MLDTHQIEGKTNKSRVAQRVQKKRTVSQIHLFMHIRQEFVLLHLRSTSREPCPCKKRDLSQGLSLLATNKFRTHALAPISRPSYRDWFEIGAR